MLIPLNNILLFLQKKKHNILLKWIADTKKKNSFSDGRERTPPLEKREAGFFLFR